MKMLHSSVKNCNDFFRTRPPMVVFFVSLILMMITTFAFTFHIKHSNKLINTDAKQNWLLLSEYVSNAKLCLGNNSLQPPSNQDDKHFVEEISVVTLISFNSTNLKNGTKVQVYYNLEGWRPVCPTAYDKDEHSLLKVNFTVPQMGNETFKVCAIVRGPKEYLPEYSEPTCDARDINGVSTILYSKSGADNKYCSDADDGFKMKLSFDGGRNFATFLSQNDRNVIYVHLMWCSYILLFFIVVVLLYAMFYQYEEVPKNHRLT